MASIICRALLGGSENVALCEQNFKDAVNGDIPTAAAATNSNADLVVECADFCRDQIATAKVGPYSSLLVSSTLLFAELT